MKRPKKLITPAPGRTVFKSDGETRLDPTGEVLTLTPFWRRREREGAVTVAARPPEGARTRSPAPAPKSSEKRSTKGDVA